jgi:hypothetical protein
MSDRTETPKPETTPAPGTARAARQGRVSGRVVTVLAVSVTLAVVLMVVAWFVW